LAEKLLQRHARTAGRPLPQLSADAQAALVQHAWTGNVRELDNVIQRAFIYTSGEAMEARHLRFEEVRASAPSVPAAPSLSAIPTDTGLGDDLKSRERRLIIDALHEGHGSRKFAAQRLGISPRTLRYKLARMRDAGVDVPASNGLDE